MRHRTTAWAAAALILAIVSAPMAAGAATTFTATLTGAQETPPNASPATGTGTVTLNDAQTTITVSLSFAGLVGASTAAHIHGPAAPGVPAPVIFPLTIPLGVTTGSVTGATFAVTPAQVADLRAGLWYFNVHSTVFPGGEIRGQILDTTAPTVTVNQAAGQADPTTAQPVHFTVTFSEPVTGFTASDVLISGTAGGIPTVTVTPTGTNTYDVAVSNLGHVGTVVATIPAAAVSDLAGNPSTASTSADDVVSFNGFSCARTCR
jgi:hypothetical protein